MTCLQYKALLDDFSDNDLALELVTKLKEHIAICDSCKKELELTNRLKELLHHTSPPDPGSLYFDDTADLIFARTIEKDNWQKNQYIKSATRVQSDFTKALLSTAAALFIFAISVVIGTSENKFAQNNPKESPVFVMTPVEQMIGPNDSPVFTKKEQLNHIQGMLLISPPGMLGRLSVIHEINRLIN